jgi:hypothetical protein
MPTPRKTLGSFTMLPPDRKLGGEMHRRLVFETFAKTFGFNRTIVLSLSTADVKLKYFSYRNPFYIDRKVHGGKAPAWELGEGLVGASESQRGGCPKTEIGSLPGNMGTFERGWIQLPLALCSPDATYYPK